MGSLKKYCFSKNKRLPNTFIGGVASDISTKELLASRLIISASAITSFRIVDSDIECYISINYTIPSNSFKNLPSLTYYNDAGGKVSQINVSFTGSVNLVYAIFPNATSFNGGTGGSFSDCTGLKYVTAPNLRNIGIWAFRNTGLEGEINYPLVTDMAFDAFALCRKITKVTLNSLVSTSYAVFSGCTLLREVHAINMTTMGAISTSRFINCPNLELVNIPKCKVIGAANEGNNFNGVKIGCIVNVDIFMQTCNAGAPDPDLTYITDTRGGTVNYIIN